MPETSVNDLKDCTVKISHEGGKNHDGSGFFVASRLILTCAHVCQQAKGEQIYIHWEGETYPVKVKYCSQDIDVFDLALLELEDSTIETPYVYLDESISIGQELFNYGYPDNYESGDVGSFKYIELDGKGFFKFKDDRVRPGLSGSPLLNLTTKKVCGMVVITIDRNQALGGRGIPTKLIYEHLDEVKQFQQSCYKKDNPFIPLTSKIEDINLIFGRETEIDSIFEILNSGSGVALIGESGIGKSSLLNLIKIKAENLLNTPRIPIYLDFGNVITENDFYYGLCSQLDIDCDYERPLKGFPLKLELEKHRLLLLLDGLRKDMVWEGFTNPVRNQLRSLANTGLDAPLRLVVSADKNLTQLFADSGSDSPFENVCLEVQIKSWEEKIIRNFINHRLADTNISFTDLEIQSIIKQSKGNPQKLMKLCYDTYKKYCH